MLLLTYNFEGAAQGFSQVGLVPIIEIPYAKYLDCGADMFYEIGKPQTSPSLLRSDPFAKCSYSHQQLVD